MTVTSQHSIEWQIRAAITESSLSQNQLAAAAGISSGQLSRFTAGERSIMLDTADKLCVVLGLRLVQDSAKDTSSTSASAAATSTSTAAPRRRGKTSAQWRVESAAAKAPKQPKRLAQQKATERAVVDAVAALAVTSTLPPYVSLADLRERVVTDRATIDGVLISLRKRGILALSVWEGRHSMTAAESAACLTIDGKKHLLCQLTTPSTSSTLKPTGKRTSRQTS